MHTVGSVDSETGEPDYIPVGFLFELNGSDQNDATMPTKFPMYRWAKLQCAS